MSLPYMEFYPSDYQAATAHLTPEEDGVYLRLLILCWQSPSCTMPNDTRWIARKLRLPGNEEIVGQILDEFFTIKAGRFYQRKQMKIFRRSRARHLERKNAGKRGGDAKALKNKDIGSSKATVLLGQKHSSALATRTRTKPRTNRKEYSITFEEFWKIYPNKSGGKIDGGKAYAQAIVTTRHEELMSGVRAYITNKETWKEWKQAGPWLRAGMWSAEYGPGKFEAADVDYTDPEWWRSRTKGPAGKDRLKNNWPVPGKRFPEGCPIAKEIWGDAI